MNTPLNHLLTFLRHRSVSADPAFAPEVRACAQWLCDDLNASGLSAQLCETPGHPVVLARSPVRPGRPTVLIYGHYDVQPAQMDDGWDTDPFQPRITPDDIIICRGAADNKGQIYSHIAGVADTLQKHGDLPVNLIFLIEGEEECGSCNLENFLVAHRDELACDVIVVSDTGMVGPGVPTITYGLRGVCTAEIFLDGPANDLHSGIFGGAVANPATALARLIGTLHNADGHIAIAGHYDDVRQLQDWEREEWSRLPFNDAFILRTTGAPALFGEAGYTSLERLWARPTVEVNGLTSGYQGAGSKTVLPRVASAKLSLRIVPDQRPDQILGLLEEHLTRHCPPGVRLRFEKGHAGAPYLCNPQSPALNAARRGLERAFGRPAVLIREGGSIPIVETFHRVLGRDTLLLGLALPDCAAHGPNENFPLANFHAGIKMNQAVLEELV